MKKYPSFLLYFLTTFALSAYAGQSQEPDALAKKTSPVPYSKWDQNIDGKVVDQKEFPAGYNGKTLRVWFASSHINNAIQALGVKFGQEKTSTVIVEGETPSIENYLAKSPDKRPDIICFNHDRIPAMAEQGIIQPITPSRKIFSAQVNMGWKGLSDHNRIYGYPIATSATGLFYNTNLIDNPPESFEELPALQKTLWTDKKIDALRFDYQNIYFSWPIIAASVDGLRPFIYGKNGAGEYDPASVGIKNLASIRGLTLLKSLIDQGALPKGKDASYGAMEKAFNTEKLAMMINGPWAIDNLVKNGIPFKISPLPRANEASPKSFVLIYGCMIAKDGQTELASDFLENYLITTEAMAAIDPNNSLGIPNNKEYFKDSYDKPYVQEMLKIVTEGSPMPDTDYMGLFWKHMGLAVHQVTNGKQEPELALELAKRNMTR